jgi:transposase
MALDHPDQTLTHVVPRCGHCQASLQGVESVDYAERQVFDLPAMRIKVTAHRAEIKVCPACGQASKGTFPPAVTHAVQYGLRVQTWAAYFTNHHHIPVERTAEICADLVLHRGSEATVLQASEQWDTYITPATDAVKRTLRAAEVLMWTSPGCG